MLDSLRVIGVTFDSCDAKPPCPPIMDRRRQDFENDKVRGFRWVGPCITILEPQDLLPFCCRKTIRSWMTITSHRWSLQSRGSRVLHSPRETAFAVENFALDPTEPSLPPHWIITSWLCSLFPCLYNCRYLLSESDKVSRFSAASFVVPVLQSAGSYPFGGIWDNRDSASRSSLETNRSSVPRPGLLKKFNRALKPPLYSHWLRRKFSCLVHFHLRIVIDCLFFQFTAAAKHQTWSFGYLHPKCDSSILWVSIRRLGMSNNPQH